MFPGFLVAGSISLALLIAAFKTSLPPRMLRNDHFSVGGGNGGGTSVGMIGCGRFCAAVCAGVNGIVGIKIQFQ
jgi:hypothetical protein